MTAVEGLGTGRHVGAEEDGAEMIDSQVSGLGSGGWGAVHCPRDCHQSS